MRATDTVLVVGAATGYEAAVISLLARKVVALEEDAELARRARAALVDHAIASVEAIEGRLRHGHRPRAPYDAIVFAGAVAAMPDEIVEQLAEGGRLLAVERRGAGLGHATLTQRTGGTLGATRYIRRRDPACCRAFCPLPSSLSEALPIDHSSDETAAAASRGENRDRRPRPGADASGCGAGGDRRRRPLFRRDRGAGPDDDPGLGRGLQHEPAAACPTRPAAGDRRAGAAGLVGMATDGQLHRQCRRHPRQL